MMLDISNPASPLLLGHTSFDAGVEGNAHSVAEARGGEIGAWIGAGAPADAPAVNVGVWFPTRTSCL